jgi:hypothetical protein
MLHVSSIKCALTGLLQYKHNGLKFHLADDTVPSIITGNNYSTLHKYQGHFRYSLSSSCFEDKIHIYTRPGSGRSTPLI